MSEMSTDSHFDSLRDYLSAVDELGLLREIEGADWEKEIGALTETVALSDNPVTLLFDSIVDYPRGHRVVTNPYVSIELQALALGFDPDQPKVKLVEQWREKLADLEQIPTVEVSEGPITQNVIEGDDVNILDIPVPLWHEEDGGRYFGTGDTVITQPVDGEWTNLGVYRTQVHSDRKMGLYVAPNHHGRAHMQEYWDRGEDAPVVVTGGQSPAVYASACYPLPGGQSELEFAGGLKDEPIEVVVDEENTGLPVPAHSEIAVLGHVPSPDEELHEEGPFGECRGYYTGKRELPVIHVDAIWHRDRPILQGNPPMRGSASTHALGAEITTSARIWESIEEDIPGIQGVYSLYQQCQSGPDLLAISLEQQYPGHVKQAAAQAVSVAAGVRTNAVIVVDEDIDPGNMQDVLFAFSTRCDAPNDINYVHGLSTSNLDPRLTSEERDRGETTHNPMLIDACIPYSRKDEFPPTCRIDEDLRERMKEKWNIDEWKPE